MKWYQQKKTLILQLLKIEVKAALYSFQTIALRVTYDDFNQQIP